MNNKCDEILIKDVSHTLTHERLEKPARLQSVAYINLLSL